MRLTRCARARGDMRAGRQRRVSRRDTQADQLFAARVLARGMEGDVADVFVRPRLARAGDAKVVQHGGPVGVVADDDKAFLRPQDHQRLESQKAAAERRQPLGRGGRGATARRGSLARRLVEQ